MEIDKVNQFLGFCLDKLDDMIDTSIELGYSGIDLEIVLTEFKKTILGFMKGDISWDET